VLLASALARDPGVEAKHGHWGPLGALLEAAIAGRRFSRLIEAWLRLATPLIAVGAPAGAYYPEVARRLDARLFVPERAEVCNAIGAVVGQVSETCDVLVNQPMFKVFRVHDPAGIRDYPEALPAIEDARRVSRELALAAARRAGACEPQVETSVLERRARGGPGADGDYLAEATVRSVATGRPATRGA
jgi:N-methylhydantoinase A/oxoprolinase/acetone carboxylase beta subunit